MKKFLKGLVSVVALMSLGIGGVPSNTEAASPATVSYTVHGQTYGWQEARQNGSLAGSVGQARRLEAIKLNVSGDGGIKYQVHGETYGWQNWGANGQEAGSTGSGKRVEAIRIELTGMLAEQYNVVYRVHGQSYGWQDWKSNGEIAGTTGQRKRVEAIEVKLVEKDTATPTGSIVYQVHGQTYGWQNWVADGAQAGSIGQAKRLEAIKLNVAGDGGIRYQVHGQTYGWQGWKSNGQEAGSTGSGKRVEAIKIELTGNLATKFDVQYRVHGQTYGWQGWKTNGELAGSEGQAKRVEAIEVKLVPKNTTPMPMPPVYVTDVNLSLAKTTLTVGETTTATSSVVPADASNTTITYSSSNTGIATIDASGKVTAVAAGTATIKATSHNNISKSVNVTVNAKTVAPVINVKEVIVPWGTAWNNSMLSQGFVSGTDENGRALAFSQLTVKERQPMNTRVSGNYLYDVSYGGTSVVMWVKVQPAVYNKEAVRAEMLRLVNEERARVGAPALVYDATLNAASDIRADELVTSYSHFRPNGEDARTSIFEIDPNYFRNHNGAVENLAARTHAEVTDTELANYYFQQWKNSADHCANMTNPSWKYFGFSYNSTKNTDTVGIYAHQFFGGDTFQ